MAAVLDSSMNPDPSTSTPGIPSGARRASDGMPGSAARPEPEVVAVARRRQFSIGQKRALLAEADRCKAAGTLGAFLRSERIYSSMLSSLRRRRTITRLRCSICRADGSGFGPRFFGASATRSAASTCRRQVSAVTAFRALNPASGGGREPPLGRPGRADLFHVRALQVLDGLTAGASQRELAVALFVSAAAARGWQPDGALRAQVRYLIRRPSADGRRILSAGRRRPDRFPLRQRGRAREQVGFP